MRKSNTLEGIIDKLELCDTELEIEIKRLKDFGGLPPNLFSLISSTLNRRNTAMKSLKRLLE